MNRRNESERTVVCLFEGGFAGHNFFPLKLDKTTPLGISLFDQIAFHSSNFITGTLSLAREDEAVIYIFQEQSRQSLVFRLEGLLGIKGIGLG